MACPMSIHRLPKLEDSPIFDRTSILAISSVATLLLIAGVCCFALLHRATSTKVRILFTWHLFGALTHLTLEVSYLYNVFFTSMSKLDATYTWGLHSTPFTPVNVSFLGNSKRLYGSFYGTSLTARFWQEYAKADTRWGGSDLTITGVEMIMVFVVAPLSLYVCHLLYKNEHTKAWFWMAVIGVGELYGGFVVLLPEWLSGSPHLDNSSFLTLWVYLVFPKGLRIFFSLWILTSAYFALTSSAQYSNQGLSSGITESKQLSTVERSGKVVQRQKSCLSQQQINFSNHLISSK
ncbi:EBP-domain-containing protein [Mollisia scopiformis]|uniref:EBP-domain-containing protein n=1 Tax=Mollisia scopiformis TaxID=149040 RepID=A0A132B2R3_MOLSC|nr:EBP-domain-containing protein [Mollisia scopiformis]KUJ06329.1 EBP-domain-containing protein [Mollisia scopiformis]